MRRKVAAVLAGAAAFLALAARGADGKLDTVDLKGWYSEVPVTQCHDASCVCLAFDPGKGLPPFPGWVVQEDAGGIVLVRVSEARKPRHCFQNSPRWPEAVSRLLLNIVLYRRDGIGLPAQAQIRSEAAAKTTAVYIEPVP